MLLPRAEGYELKEVVSTTTMSVLFLGTDQVRAQVQKYMEHIQTPLVIILVVIMVVVILYTWKVVEINGSTGLCGISFANTYS
jgi:hypothetical protein